MAEVNRREFVIGAAASACVLGLPAQRVLASSKPNILIVIMDQLSADSASYRIGSRYIRTPNMDSIAARGRVYTRAYCANPLCVPSRTSMFIGQYPTVTGVMDNDAIGHTQIDTRRFPMMGRIFQNSGYETSFFGKWHMPCPVEHRELHGFGVTESKMIDTETATRAVSFILQDHKSPFLTIASFLNPHNICEWARGQKLPLGEIGQPPPADQCPPLRPNHAPQKDEPDIMTFMRRSYQAAPMFPVGGFDDAKWRQYEWAYYRLIEKVDAQIGLVLQALRSSGREQDTLVVMLADHGDCQGAHGWNQKTVLYEEAVRVPFVISWPGTIAPGTSNRLVNTGIDLIPTLLGYAGIRPSTNLPGLSLEAADADPRKYVIASNRLAQGVSLEGRRPVPTGRMLRGQRYKYCAYSEGSLRESLVDLKTDPGEMVNLARAPHFRSVLSEHRTMLAAWCNETRDAFDIPCS